MVIYETISPKLSVWDTVPSDASPVGRVFLPLPISPLHIPSIRCSSHLPHKTVPPRTSLLAITITSTPGSVSPLRYHQPPAPQPLPSLHSSSTLFNYTPSTIATPTALPPPPSPPSSPAPKQTPPPQQPSALPQAAPCTLHCS